MKKVLISSLLKLLLLLRKIFLPPLTRTWLLNKAFQHELLTLG